MLIVVVAVAVSIRVVFELLCPVLPYLAVGVAIVTALRLVRWWRERW